MIELLVAPAAAEIDRESPGAGCPGTGGWRARVLPGKPYVAKRETIEILKERGNADRRCLPRRSSVWTATAGHIWWLPSARMSGGLPMLWRAEATVGDTRPTCSTHTERCSKLTPGSENPASRITSPLSQRL